MVHVTVNLLTSNQVEPERSAIATIMILVVRKSMVTTIILRGHEPDMGSWNMESGSLQGPHGAIGGHDTPINHAEGC